MCWVNPGAVGLRPSHSLSGDLRGDWHSEADHAVDHGAGDADLNLLGGQSPGAEAPADQNLVPVERRFHEPPFHTQSPPANPSASGDGVFTICNELVSASPFHPGTSWFRPPFPPFRSRLTRNQPVFHRSTVALSSTSKR